MKEEGLQFDVAHTSVLKRAIHTLQGHWPNWSGLAAGQQVPLAFERASLRWPAGPGQGRDRRQARRRAVKVASFLRHPAAADGAGRSGPPDPRPSLRRLDRNALPATESLATTLERVLPYWHDAIAPQLKEGKTVLVTAHGTCCARCTSTSTT